MIFEIVHMDFRKLEGLGWKKDEQETKKMG